MNEAMHRSSVTVAVLRSTLAAVNNATTSDVVSLDTMLRYPVAFRTSTENSAGSQGPLSVAAQKLTRQRTAFAVPPAGSPASAADSTVPVAAVPRTDRDVSGMQSEEPEILEDLRMAVIRLYFRLRSGLARLILCQQRNYSPALRLLLASAPPASVSGARAAGDDGDDKDDASVETVGDFKIDDPNVSAERVNTVAADEDDGGAAAVKRMLDERLRALRTEAFGQLQRDSSYLRSAISESITLWKHLHSAIARMSQVCCSTLVALWFLNSFLPNLSLILRLDGISDGGLSFGRRRWRQWLS